MIYDIAIIGAGPAGLSAAIYTARAQLKTLLFGDETKGNLYKAHVIANYFGLPESPTGPELTAAGLKQALDYGTEHFRQEIVDITVDQTGQFILKDSQQQHYQAKTILLATGQSYLLSGIAGEQQFTGKGVSYCVICDGFFFRNKKVAVIGSGNHAAEEALQLLSFTPNVTILSHGKDFSFSEIFQKELSNRGITCIRTPRLSTISGENLAQKILLSSPLPTGEDELLFDGFFMAIGVAGANAFAKKLGLEMEGSYIKVDKNGLTNIPGLFAAGDCTGSPAQVASSVGNGCNAALSAIKSIRGLSNYIQYN